MIVNVDIEYNVLKEVLNEEFLRQLTLFTDVEKITVWKGDYKIKIFVKKQRRLYIIDITNAGATQLDIDDSLLWFFKKRKLSKFVDVLKRKLEYERIRRHI